jgi:hypothetical protein
MNIDFGPDEFEYEIWEMQWFIDNSRLSISLASFAARGRLYVFEFGWGGATLSKVPARTAAEVAAAPWEGMGPYSTSVDGPLESVPHEWMMWTCPPGRGSGRPTQQPWLGLGEVEALPSKYLMPTSGRLPAGTCWAYTM